MIAGSEKGTVPICAQHPTGRSGKWGQSPFPILLKIAKCSELVWKGTNHAQAVRLDGRIGPDGLDVRLRVVFAVPRREGAATLSHLRADVRAGLYADVYAELCSNLRAELWAGRCPGKRLPDLRPGGIVNETLPGPST